MITRMLRNIGGLTLTRGRVGAALYLKGCRLALTRHLAGTPLATLKGIGLTKDGLPRFLPINLRELIREGNTSGISFSLMILSLGRTVKGGIEVDLSSITDSPKITEDLSSDIEAFLVEYKIKPFATDWPGFHWSMKSGPAGPSLITALRDFRNLPASLKDHLVTLGGLRAKDLFDNYNWWSDSDWGYIFEVFDYVPKSNSIRKLSIKDDSEGKSRVFAILDYYSQSMLLPIHDSLMKILRQIPSDRTFVQGDGINLVPDSHYHSIDLSTATDRFPVSLQESIMSKLIGEGKAASWRAILTKYGFDYQGKQVFYNTGQPMGAYSSWAMFTLSHHYLVFKSAKNLGIPNFRNYVILGDDVVIANDLVAKEYTRLLSLIGVPVSDSKTHVSLHAFEFAKRWFFKGIEVTPFPFLALLEFGSKYHLILELFRQTMRRGFGDRGYTLGNPVLFPALLEVYGIKGRLHALLVRKYLQLSFIPLGGETIEEVGRLGLAFFSLSDMSTPTTTNLQLIANFFEWFANDVAVVMRQQENSKMIKEVMGWEFALQCKLPSFYIEGGDDQSLAPPSLDWYQVFPVIGVLSEISAKQLDSENRPSDFGQFATVWTSVRTALLTYPKVDGINPYRSGRRVVAARASLADRLDKSITRYINGIERL